MEQSDAIRLCRRSVAEATRLWDAKLLESALRENDARQLARELCELDVRPCYAQADRSFAQSVELLQDAMGRVAQVYSRMHDMIRRDAALSLSEAHLVVQCALEERDRVTDLIVASLKRVTSSAMAQQICAHLIDDTTAADNRGIDYLVTCMARSKTRHLELIGDGGGDVTLLALSGDELDHYYSESGDDDDVADVVL